LREKEIETVIPREDNACIAILKGEFKGEVGKMLSRDKKREKVTVQIGMTDIIEVSLDDCSATFQ
jgi:ribosomal protein L24